MSLKINVLAGWLCHLTGMLIGLFLMPYILGLVGDESYGTWLLLGSMASYTSLLYLGFGETISRYVSQHYARQEWDELNETVSGIFAGYLVSGTIAFLGAGVLAIVLPFVKDWGQQPIGEIQGAILILGFNAALAICGSANGGILYGIQRFDIERGIQIVGMFVRLTLVLTLLTVELPLMTLALIFTAVTVVEQILYYIAARWKVPTLRIRFGLMKWSTMKESYLFAAYNAIGRVAMKLIYETDNIVIGFALGPAFIVPYAIGMRLSDMIRAPIGHIGEVFLPKAGELQAAGRHDELRSLLVKGMGLAFLLSGGFFIGAWYFGGLLIDAWMPKTYPESHTIFVILLGAQLAALPISVLHMTIVGMGHVRVPSLLKIVAAVCNLVLSLVLVQIYGIWGVAIGTLIPILLIDLCILLPYGSKQIGLSLSVLFRQVVVPQLLPLAALFAYSKSVSTLPLTATWPILIAVTIGGGVALGSVWGAQWLFTRRLSTGAVTTT